MSRPGDDASETDDTYERSVEIHRRIEELYPRVEEYAAYFRDWARADAAIPTRPGKRRRWVRVDPWVCALAIKAATTKRSVMTLCEAGDGHNAMVLARVLMENACLLEWLLRGEYRERIDAYVLWSNVALERHVETIQRFRDRFVSAGGEPDVHSDPDRREIAAEVFGNNNTDRPTWRFVRGDGKGAPVTVRQIFDGITASFEHAVLYGAIGSDIVHSGPTSLKPILEMLWKRETFILQPFPTDEHRTIALAISNIAMLLVLDSFNEYVGLGLSEVLAELKATNQQKRDVSDKDRRDAPPDAL